MTCQMTMSLGVYLLGAADQAERSRVEAHLPGCLECQAELAELTPLPGLLTIVPQDMRPAARTAGAEPGRAARGTGPVGEPGGRREASSRRGFLARPARAVAVAAAGAVAAGFALGYWLMPAGTAAGPASATFTGVNPATHVVATAALTPTSWGTSIQLRLRGIPLNVECRLVAHSRTGATEVTGVWDAWSRGPVSVPASAGWRAADITSLQVVAGTKPLVTIDTSGRPAAPAHS
jgi:putative zinc finger protein